MGDLACFYSVCCSHTFGYIVVCLFLLHHLICPLCVHSKITYWNRCPRQPASCPPWLSSDRDTGDMDNLLHEHVWRLSYSADWRRRTKVERWDGKKRSDRNWLGRTVQQSIRLVLSRQTLNFRLTIWCPGQPDNGTKPVVQETQVDPGESLRPAIL